MEKIKKIALKKDDFIRGTTFVPAKITGNLIPITRDSGWDWHHSPVHSQTVLLPYHTKQGSLKRGHFVTFPVHCFKIMMIITHLFADYNLKLIN